jgi:sortase (surface protein transpeptidase)
MPSLNFLSPDWFQPTTLEEASEDPRYWINEVLPYEEHRHNDQYLVIPTMGLVVPIVDVPAGSADYQSLSAGQTININDHLINGVMHFPQTAEPGELGNMFIFGHSNGAASWPGEFNTIFAKAMGLEVGIDQLWLFKKRGQEFDLFKYDVVASYNTTPKNVQVMLWDGE